MITRSKKNDIVSAARQEISDAQLCSIVVYNTLSVKKLEKFRKELNQQSAMFKTIKKTLLKIALSETELKSTEFNSIGNVAFVYSKENPFSPLKAIGSNSDITCVSTMINGTRIDASLFKRISKLDSINQLYQSLMLAILTPIKNFMLALKSIFYKLYYYFVEVKNNV